MARQDKYLQYFMVEGENILISTDIYKVKKELKRNEFWTLLRIVMGTATEGEIKAFNGMHDYKKMREIFNKSRKSIYKELILRDGEKCSACGETKNLQVDHVIPLVRGGSNELDNLQILCRSCNSRKGSS